MITIVPFTSINSLRFGKATQEDCISAFGNPVVSRKNKKGMIEYEYSDKILRFDPSRNSTLFECTLLPLTESVVSDISITWDKTFLRAVCILDGNPIDLYGFIVLRNLGLAITGIHDDDISQLAITVFQEGAFDALLTEGVPYVLT